MRVVREGHLNSSGLQDARDIVVILFANPPQHGARYSVQVRRPDRDAIYTLSGARIEVTVRVNRFCKQD